MWAILHAIPFWKREDFQVKKKDRDIFPWKIELQLLFTIWINIFLIFPGFEKPSAIQQRAVKPIVKGRDVIAQ